MPCVTVSIQPKIIRFLEFIRTSKNADTTIVADISNAAQANQSLTLIG